MRYRPLLTGILAALPSVSPDPRVGDQQGAWCDQSLDFRVFNWNASGSDPNWNLGKDQDVADFIVHNATSIGANVITLQEVTPLCLHYIAQDMPGWQFYWDWFDDPDDLIVVGVDGAATQFFSKRLCDVSSDPAELPDPAQNPPPFWWGYVQVEYQGVLVTSVHTRSYWKHEHVTQLHEEVTTGIVSGDFNYVDATVDPGVPCIPGGPVSPPSPDWFQTDLDLEWTIDGYDNGVLFQKKIDHVLTVEEPREVCGDAIGDGSEWNPPVASAHRALAGGVTLRQVWVDFDYSGPETGSFSKPFDTLQEGVQMAQLGDTVRIKSGASFEILTITKALSLESHGGSAIIGD